MAGTLIRLLAKIIFLCSLCAPNGETACAPYFSNSPVLVNTTDIDFMIFVDNAVGTLMSFELNATASLVANCFKLAQAMLCHSAFPFCSSTNRGTTREVCKNTCDVFGPGGVCENVVAWEELFPDIYELMLSNCDTRVNPGGSSPECVHVSLENTGTKHYLLPNLLPWVYVITWALAVCKQLTIVVIVAYLR